MRDLVDDGRMAVAVTGGVACGKSHFCALLKERFDSPECAFLDTDRVVGELLERVEIQQEIVSVVTGHSVGRERMRAWDKAVLREVLFENSAIRDKVEALLHPLVLEQSIQWRKGLAREVRWVFYEVPLLYEVDFPVPRQYDVVVAASYSTQLKRLQENRGMEDLLAGRIIGAQWPVARKVALADLVVWNDGDRKLLQFQADWLVRQCQAGIW